VVQPSLYESFSISVLEAFLLKIPVLVNGECAVLRGHCVRSNAGLYYNSYYEFEGALRRLLSDEKLRQRLGENGYRYVRTNYSWDVIRDRYVDFLRTIWRGRRELDERQSKSG
jgi:glycosyltransferase involved in cell wall biosynthesis